MKITIPSLFSVASAVSTTANTLCIRQNNFFATEFKSGVHNLRACPAHLNAQAPLGGLPPSLIFHLLAGSGSVLSSPKDLSVAQEQGALLLLGCAFLLLGFFWLRKLRQADASAARPKLTEHPVRPNWHPSPVQRDTLVIKTTDDLARVHVPAGLNRDSLGTPPGMPLDQAQTTAADRTSSPPAVVV